MENKGKIGTVENTLPDQVLDYYKFYSQSNKLPQYFCGATDVDIAHTDKDLHQPSVSSKADKQEANIPTITIDLVENQCRNPSPTSSVASNRKLEWDNGADIGYQNCLHKSISLPVLNVTQKGENLSSTQRYSSSEEDDNISIRLYKSSPTIKHTSSQNSSNETSSDSFGGIHLVTKIGMPAAESTPFNKEKLAKSDPGCSYPVTSQVSTNILGKLFETKSDEFINVQTKFKGGVKYDDVNEKTLQGEATSDLRNVLILFKNTDDSINMDPDKSHTKLELNPKKSKDLHITTFNYELSGSKPTLKEDLNDPYSNLNISDARTPKKNQNSVAQQNPDINRNTKNIILTLSKPTYVECIDPIIKNDKNIQTSSENASVGTQVEIKSTTTSSSNNQSIKYVFHDYKDFCNSSTTQTGSDDVVSNCNSFEYLYGSACEQNSKKSTVSTSSGDNSKSNTTENGSVNILKRASVKIDLSNLTSSSASSTENYLTSLLSTGDSQKHDINKNLGILQKLLNSKRYNEETKQYYIKRVLKSILKNYFNDSSSISSEKITPNIDDKLPQRTKYVHEEKNSDTIPSTYDVIENAKKSDLDGKEASDSHLKSNVPWFPSPKRSQSNTKVPQNILHKIIGSRNKNIFTQQLDQQEQCNYSNANPSSPDYFTPHTVSSEETNESSKLKASDWKKEQTVSEILFDQRNHVLGTGDSPNINNNEILCFAQQERLHQLHWINNEIEHLSKLRQLLETSKKVKNPVVERKSSSDKNVKKTTSVYMITTETVGNNVNKHNNINNLKNCEITKVKGSSDINYKIQDNEGATNYRFSELSKLTLPHKLNHDRNYLKIDKNTADVEVVPTKRNLTDQEPLYKNIESRKKESSEIVDNVTNKSSILKNEAKYPTANSEANHKRFETNNSNEDPYVHSRDKDTLKSTSDKSNYKTKYQSNSDSKQTHTNEQTLSVNKDKDSSVILERNSQRSSSPSFDRRKNSRVSSVPKSSRSPSSDKKKTSTASTTTESRKSSSEKKRSGSIPEAGRSSTKISKDVEPLCTLRCTCAVGTCQPSLENEQCFNNAKVISSTVTPSVTNPKDTVRRFVIEVPIPLSGASSKRDKAVSIMSKDGRNRESRDRGLTNSGSRDSVPVSSSSTTSSSINNISQTRKKSSSITIVEDKVGTTESKMSLDTSSSSTSSTYFTCSEDSSDSSASYFSVKSKKDSSKSKIALDDRKYSKSTSTKRSKNGKDVNSSKKGSGEENKYSKRSTAMSEDSTNNSTSESSSSATSSSESLVLCSCCKCIVNNAVYGGGRDNRQSPFSFQAQQQPFCGPCYNVNKNNNWNTEQSFFTPQHTCRCNTASKLRETLQELNELEKREKYCKKPSKKGDSDKDIYVKKPIAYLLTFEPGDTSEYKEPEVIRSLEEVRIKIPFSASVESKGTETRHTETKHKKHRKEKHKSSKNLQDYLVSNRPSFIKAAEDRRKCMIELAIMREQRCQKYKQLLALTNGVPMQNLFSENHRKRIFTTKEMKSMTAKKYNKLPEVQQKLLDDRERQIKKANRMLADIFNKKLRAKVLQGNPSVSASASVLNFL